MHVTAPLKVEKESETLGEQLTAPSYGLCGWYCGVVVFQVDVTFRRANVTMV